MILCRLLLPLAILPLMASANGADFDPQKAFDALRDFRAGGTWVSTDDTGAVTRERHVVSPSKKFVRIEYLEGGTGFAAIYGIDPATGDITLWAFDYDEKGSVQKWVCTDYKNGTWTWANKKEPSATKAMLTRVGKDELTFNFEGEKPVAWKRKQ